MFHNRNHRLRTKAIQQFDALYYKAGELRCCHRRIWSELARHIWGISYKSYLNELKRDVSDLPDLPPQVLRALQILVRALLHDAPAWRRERYIR